jgi:hypothetical protein
MNTHGRDLHGKPLSESTIHGFLTTWGLIFMIRQIMKSRLRRE